MKLLIQRVNSASVTIDNKIHSSISKGLLVFVGFSKEHTLSKTDKLVEKLLHFRIFESSKKGFDLSIEDIKGEVLIVSQFTLFANCSSGRKPKFNDSLEYTKAEEEYNTFISKLKEQSTLTIQTGVFGANMNVSLENDGPVTLVLEK